MKRSKHRPARLDILSAGAYLMTVSNKGEMFALALTVSESIQGGAR